MGKPVPLFLRYWRRRPVAGRWTTRRATPCDRLLARGTRRERLHKPFLIEDNLLRKPSKVAIAVLCALHCRNRALRQTTPKCVAYDHDRANNNPGSLGSNIFEQFHNVD